MVATLLRSPLDELVLPAGDALAFVDAASGAPVLEGLRLSLVLREGGRLLGRAVASPSGAWHWPDLAERWRVMPPVAPVLADVVVRDEQERFLPLTLPWPLPSAAVGQVMSATVLGASRLLQVRLLSAPQRRAPPGMASLFAQLAWQATGLPAAWARVRLTDGDGRTHEGATDADGRLALHLPSPRPNRPGSPPSPAAVLSVFSAPAIADAALARGAPDVLAFASQPAVLALADVGTTAAYVPSAFTPGEPLVLATLGLPATQRELRLAPI